MTQNSSRIYIELIKFGSQYSQWSDVLHLGVMVWMMVGIIANWKEPEIYLSFDTSQLWEEYCMIRLCVVHQGRALPLCWRVIKHSSSTVEMSTYRDMFKRASKLLPVNIKVVLLAFANPELVRFVRELKWQCRIRIKGNFWIHHPKHDIKNYFD